MCAKGETARPPAAEAEYPSHHPVTVELAGVEPQQVSWLWNAWIPQGCLSLCIGHAGQGKSWLSLALAAAVSRGWPLPGDDRPREPKRALLIGAEDGLADTVRPRLDAIGADVRQITALEGVATEEGERGFVLADVGPLEQVLAGGDFGLVVIDPVTAFVGRIDSYKDAEVRGLLAPLAHLAHGYGVAVVAIMHLRKGQADTALQRASGSIAWGAAARSVFAVGTDPQAQGGTTERHVLPVKHNLCPPPAGVTFSLDGGRFTWGGPSQLSAQQLMAAQGGEDGGALAEAEDVLREILSGGPVLATAALREAREAGVSEATFRRARQALGVKTDKAGFGGSGRWALSLPDTKALKAPIVPLRRSTPEEDLISAEAKALKGAHISQDERLSALRPTEPVQEPLAADLDGAIDQLPLDALRVGPEWDP